MGLFGWGKAKKAADDAPAPEEIARRWRESYRANPRVYQKKDSGAPLGSLTLTEGVDTLLPLHPEGQWAVDGQPVSQWILSLVSLTEDRVLGHMDYPASMRRLRPFVLAEAEGWVMVRAMTHQELDGLFAGLPRTVI